MLNYETILSSYDDKMTLMQWLKKVEEALKHASATGFRVNKKGNATISFILDFEDGTTLESGDIVLQQGESVNGAYIENNHLFITLTNGQVIDAGLMFNGNLTINGTLDATKVTGDEIVEKMSGYSFVKMDRPFTPYFTFDYAGVVKNGNKITFSMAGSILPTENWESGLAQSICSFVIPREIGDKIVPINAEHCAYTRIQGFISYTSSKDINVILAKSSPTTIYFYFCPLTALTANQKLYFRYEITFLLGDNLAIE